VDFERAVEAAPPGWRHFGIGDLDRLPTWVLGHEMLRLPAFELAALNEGDRGAQEKVLRALFWTLVYHLEPARWDALSQAEPIAHGLMGFLPAAPLRVIEVGAGSGRLTRHLSQRSECVLAIEPALGLAHLLRQRLPGVHVVSAWAEAIPTSDGWSQLTAACGVIGPDPVVLSELERVTAPGGEIVLISPECPEWFEANGWRRLIVERPAAPAHPDWIDGFFGPPDPPHELVFKHIS
jgi:SAM-dependent methyltransferase